MTLGFLGKAAFLYAIGNILMRATSFLLIPIYAHYLEMNDYGLLLTLLLTVQFIGVAMNCGTEHGIIRFAGHYEKHNQIDALMGTTALISLISSLIVACVCLTLLVPFFRLVLHRQDVYLLIGFTVASSFFQSLCDTLTAYYRSQHKPTKYTLVGVATALMLTALSFIFLSVLNMGVVGALLAKTITYGGIFAAIAWRIYSKTGFRVSARLATKLLHFGVPLSMASFGQFAVTGASIYFLSLLAGLESVAIFSLGHKLASVLVMLLVLPFQLSFQPYVFSQLDRPDIKKQMARLLTYLMWSIAGGTFCVLFAARLLLPLIAPPEYADAFIVTLLMMPAMAFMGIFYYGETLLKASQKSYIIGLIVVGCAIFSVIANYFLVNYWDWYGALLASNITMVFLGISLFLIGLKKYSIPTEWRHLWVTGVLFLGVLLTNLILVKSSLYLYCILNIVLAGVVLLFVVRSTLWDTEEKQSVRRAMDKVKALFQKRPLEHVERSII